MRLREQLGTLAAALLLCAASSFAQSQQPDRPPTFDQMGPLQPLDAPPNANSGRPPIPAARGVDDSPFDPQNYDPAQVEPDHNTLAGAAPFTLGSMQHRRNIFDPALSFSQIGQTLPLNSGPTIVTSNSIISGSLNFDRTWSVYNLFATYNGGETFNFGYNNTASTIGTVAPHYQFHNLVVSQQADWARWHLLFRDDFMASPGASFTGQGMGGPGLSTQFASLVGSSLNSLASSFLPSETINTAEAMRYRNSVLGQAQYAFSRRASITFSSAYGLLHFSVPGFVNSNVFDAQVGYDYLLDPANSVAVLGSYGKINYSGTGSSTTDYVGALAYGRKITGRLAFQVAAGPQEIQSNGGALGTFHLLFASVNSLLQYERRRSGVSFSFVRGLTSGSGIFQGATGDTFTGKAHYQFTRFWSGSLSGGYAINNSLVPKGAVSTRFDNWFVGANLGRQMGLHAQVNLNYGAQEQKNPPGCTPATCGATGLQQTVGLSVNWHLRPSGL